MLDQKYLNARPVPMLDQLKVKCRISNKLKIKRL